MTFLIIMLAGLVGLLLMALPGFQQHGHAGAGHIAPPAHGAVHLGHSGGAQAAGHALPGAHSGHVAPHVHGAPPAAGAAHGPGAAQAGGQPAGFELTRLIPSPRAIFSIAALFGAFGFALLPLVQFWQLAAVLAIVPAWGIEHFAVRPLWDLMFQFQGTPSSPMEALVTCDAKAVTPFRNGKGLVAVEQDGRVVQFSARLQESHLNVRVKVGDDLCVEEVDSATQHMIVSVK